MSNIEFKPHFEFDDIRIQDLKEENYVDPYYKLRRPIEPERLQAIYQQAFIFDLLYKFAKEHLPDIPNSHKDQNNKLFDNEKATDTTIDSIKQKVLEYLFKNQINVKPVEEEKFKEESVYDNIWDTDELNILRKNFAKIKENNIGLKSKLVVVLEENKELKDKLEKIKFETKHMPDEIKTLEKENERLYIRVKELELRYNGYLKELEDFDKTIKEMKDNEYDLKKNLSDVNSEKLKLEFEITKIKMKMKSIRNELKHYFMEKCENYKLKYLKEIQSLNKNIDELKAKYNGENLENQKLKKALEHLRTHFMSSYVPYEPSCKIDDSQIKVV